MFFHSQLIDICHCSFVMPRWICSKKWSDQLTLQQCGTPFDTNLSSLNPKMGNCLYRQIRPLVRTSPLFFYPDLSFLGICCSFFGYLNHTIMNSTCKKFVWPSFGVQSMLMLIRGLLPLLENSNVGMTILVQTIDQKPFPTGRLNKQWVSERQPSLYFMA